jgi:hypothetical protein
MPQLGFKQHLSARATALHRSQLRWDDLLEAARLSQKSNQFDHRPATAIELTGRESMVSHEIAGSS